MASNFPTNLDNFSNPTTGSKLDSPSHAGQHGDANDAIEALETKIGIGASPAGSATAGYAFVHSSGGTTAWSQVGYQGITSGTATSGQVLTAGTATGTSIWSTPTGGMTQIGSTLTLSGATSFNWTGIPQTYKSLRIVIENFYFASANLVSILPNNNSGSVYVNLALYNENGTVSSFQSTSTSLTPSPATWTASSGNARYNNMLVEISNYTNTTNSKLINSYSNGIRGAGGNQALIGTSRMDDNNAITSIYITAGVNFSGGYAILYGVS
jgi:hypothetical protein